VHCPPQPIASDAGEFGKQICGHLALMAQRLVFFAFRRTDEACCAALLFTVRSLRL